jgi:hypothetical protein
MFQFGQLALPKPIDEQLNCKKNPMPESTQQGKLTLFISPLVFPLGLSSVGDWAN